MKFLADEYHLADTIELTIRNAKHPEWEPWIKFKTKKDMQWHLSKRFNMTMDGYWEQHGIREVCQLLKYKPRSLGIDNY